jgi:hypothetical protein
VSGWWVAKIRRFVRYFSGRVRPAERAALEGWLAGPQLRLFDSMHRADQRHGLDVVEALRRAGHAEPDLLVAGLLHDCGKGRSIRVWHRVGWSLADHYDGAAARLVGALPGFAPALAIIDAHAGRSADLALAAGCTVRTVDLIRHQAEPTEEELGRALLLADRAN